MIIRADYDPAWPTPAAGIADEPGDDSAEMPDGLRLARVVAGTHRIGRVENDGVRNPVKRAEHEQQSRALVGGRARIPWA